MRSSDNNTDIIMQKIRTNMEDSFNESTFRARKQVKTLDDAGKKGLIDTIINKHQGEGTSPSKELEFYFGNDIKQELTAHKTKMDQSRGWVSPMIPINYDYGRQNGRKNGGKKGKTQRKNKKSKKSKTQRKIKKTKKSKTRKSTRRRR